MKILYLTTSREQSDYHHRVSQQKKVANPSNQHFHAKLISLLSLSYEVFVFTTHPLDEKILPRSNTINNYYYPGYFNVSYLRNITLLAKGINYASNVKPDIIFVDTNNTTLLRLALNIKQRHHTKIVGIVTDNPINITGAKSNYASKVFKLSAQLDGFVVLTEGLNKLFNSGNKPYFIIPGFIDLSFEPSEKTEDYAFFAGALYEKYGVTNLVEAFKDSKYKLLILGHGPLKQTLERIDSDNITFLGLKSPEDVMKLSSKALININPRPIDSQIDLFSVPSKTLDYINTGVPTLSTRNKIIEDLVGDNVFWIDDNSPQTIIKGVNKILGNYEEYKDKAAKARKLLRTSLGKEYITKQLDNLLNKL